VCDRRLKDVVVERNIDTEGDFFSEQPRRGNSGEMDNSIRPLQHFQRLAEIG
jgi:hypothetical protein